MNSQQAQEFARKWYESERWLKTQGVSDADIQSLLARKLWLEFGSGKLSEPIAINQ